MLGNDLRVWFELFDGIVIYRPRSDGGHVSDGWINWSDIENRFKREKLKFTGSIYNASDPVQRDKLLNAITHYASALVVCRLLERRRLINPSSLDYRLTPFGRRVGNWGYGQKPGFKKRSLFFLIALWLKAYKFKKVITIGAAAWGVLNALKFYGAALSWAEGLPFAAWSAAAVMVLIAAWIYIKSKVSANT